MVIRDVAKLIEKIPGFYAQFVATHEKHAEASAPAEVFRIQHDKPLFIVTWGPLISEHIKLIRRHVPNARILYYAQSFGWNIKVPPRVPIICVSRFVMSQWALHAPENFIAYIPPPLNPVFKLENQKRDIDILVHRRKQNQYCLEKLIPALERENLTMKIITDWIPQEQFAALLNRTKVFLYVTELHKTGWRRRLPGEGFGLPALEALACGAIVGSNLLGGVTDFLTPGENCIKLQNGDVKFDLAQIRDAIKNFRIDEQTLETVITQYQPDAVMAKWKNLLETLR